MNKAITQAEREGADAFHAPVAVAVHAGIAAALAQAQSTIKAAVKEADNPGFKTKDGKPIKYADLAAVWEACRKPLCDNGLSIVQTTDFDEKDVWLVTTLLHSSGEKISGRYPLRPTKHDPQGMGSAMTYARRYTIAALVGVVADDDDDDDDGNLASKPSGNGNGNGNAPTNGGKITALQVDTLRGMAANANADIEAFCKYLKVPSLADLPASEYSRALDALNAKLRKEKAQ